MTTFYFVDLVREREGICLTKLRIDAMEVRSATKGDHDVAHLTRRC